MSVDHQERISQLAMLRFKAQVSYEKHQHTKRAFNLTRTFLERAYYSIYHEGRGELHTDYDGERLRAYIMVWRQPNSWYGTSVQCCALDFDWTDQRAVMWVTRKLLELRPLLDDDCELMLSARYGSILGVALGAGFGIDSVILLGEPKRSLERLIERYDPPQSLGHLNLKIKPLTTMREVEHIISLKRDYFTAHPEFCWFGAREEHLAIHRAELERSVQSAQAQMRARRRPPSIHIPPPVSAGGKREVTSTEVRSPNDTQPGDQKRDQQAGQRGNQQEAESYVWVIYRGHTFLGNFSYSVQSSSIYWGHSAGLDIMLHPLIQRQSVVKTVYRVMLESMIERGVEVYKGGTAQPAVMGLGKLMERPLFSWILRKHVVFTPHHFEPYLPEVSQPQGRHTPRAYTET